MQQAYKFRIYPTKEQILLIEKSFGCVRFIYNHFLDERNCLYEKEGKSTTYTAQQNQLPALKKEYPWLKEVDSTALQLSVRHLDTAFQRFFDKESGYPNFKAKHYSKKSYTSNFVNNNIQILGQNVKLPKLGKVSAVVHRKVLGDITRVTISKSPTGKYYVSINVKNVTRPVLEPIENQVGIDLGLTDFVITSNGKRFPNPKFLKNSLEKLQYEQRALSRKELFSQNWYKQKKRVAKLHEKVKHQRQDYLHKVSTQLIKNNQIIAVESLKVKNMIKNPKLSQSISDAAWGKFVSFLVYKADMYGRTVIKIDQFFPSSKLCSHCGDKLDELSLVIRHWECPNCGITHDRDINAAVNILEEGLRILEEGPKQKQENKKEQS